VAAAQVDVAQKEKEMTQEEKEAEETREWYKDVLRMCLLDRNVSDDEHALLMRIKKKLDIEDTLHREMLAGIGWSKEEYDHIRKERQDVIENECVVCLSEQATYLVMPCFHICLCSECKDMFRNDKVTCPKCRDPIKDIRQTFTA
jgi:hypothetical protein